MNQPPFDPFDRGKVLHPPLPGDHVLSALRSELAHDLERNTQRRWMPSSRVGRAALSSILVVFFLLATAGEAWLRSPWVVLGFAAAYGMLLAGMLVAGAVPGRKHGLPRALRGGLLAVGGPLLLLSLWLSAETFLSLGEFVTAPYLHMATGCLAHSLITGGLATLGLLAIWRETDPFSPHLTGGLLGLLGGAVGTLSVELGCANSEGLHLTLGHGMVVLALTCVGYWIGPKWMSP